MTRFAYLFAGGAAYFPGLVCCLIGLAIVRFVRRRISSATGRILVVLGALLVLLSAVPQPVWLYAAWAGLLGVALLAGKPTGRSRRGWRDAVLAACVILTLVLGGMELPYHVSPTIPFKAGGRMYTIGDSLSMGADTIAGNWPALLADKTGMRPISFAFGGAKVETSLANARRVKRTAALILVELGGNDILYDTPPATFTENLDAMLSELKQRGAPVVMLELPLPPFCNGYGAAQRRLAAKYDVVLIPRRVLASVLASPGATVDELHLSPQGHHLLAERLGALGPKEGS